jgi:hypothetical protein
MKPRGNGWVRHKNRRTLRTGERSEIMGRAPAPWLWIWRRHRGRGVGFEMMDDQINRPTPRQVIESLDASLRDVAAGRLHDAHAAQAEARRLLAEYEGAASSGRGPHRDTSRRRTRPIS